MTECGVISGRKAARKLLLLRRGFEARFGSQERAPGSSQIISLAGVASEGFTAVSIFDDTRTDQPWIDFRRRYVRRFDEIPDADAVYSYDATRLLLAAINQAGHNRQQLRKALLRRRSMSISGIAGTMQLDEHLNDISEPLWMQVVRGIVMNANSDVRP